jgi:CheY-like chemotaxis protein
MGIPAYVVSSSVLAVQAQRLVRRLCECKVVRDDGVATSKGCEACRFTGFKGRMGVYELMRVTPRVRSVLIARGSDDVVRRAAQATGMRSMYKDGLRKVARGLTTEEEVRRVVPPDEVDDTEAAAEAVAVAIPASLSPDTASEKPVRVLVVDDDPALLEVLREILEGERYAVSTASNGVDALASVYLERPDLILTDLKMPGMDGLELLKRLRHDLSTCQIPVVFLTMVESLDAEAHALDLGADDYISKPVQKGRLLSRVRRALFRAHLMRSAP